MRGNVVQAAVAVFCLLLAMAFWPGTARAQMLELEDGDGRSLSLWVDLPIDVKLEDSGRDLVFLELETWSDFAALGVDIYLSVQITIFPEMNCAEWLEFYIGFYEDEGEEVLDKRSEHLECFIAVVDSDGERTVEWRFWLPDCRCYVEITGSYAVKDRDLFNYIAQPVADALREASHEAFKDDRAAAAAILRRDPTLPRGLDYLAEVTPQITAAQERTRAAKALRAALETKLRARLGPGSGAGPGNGSGAESGAGTPAGGAPARVPDDVVVFEYENGTPKDLLVKFTEHSVRGKHSPTGRAWPGGDKVYVLTAGQRREFRLACRPGSQVCMGAEFESDRMSVGGVYWGESLDGDQGCDACCLTCGGVRTASQFIWSGRRNPQGGGTGAAGAEALGTLLGLGLGIAAGVNAGRGSGAGAPPPAPRAPAHRPSGISR